MPKISLDNLERYDGHLKDWCDARFAERKVHENWHEAGPSGAVAFYPVPNRPIDPVVNFAFTETLPSGDKSPTNPSTITGVSSINVRHLGANFAYTAASSRLSLQSDGYYGGTVNNTGSSTLYAWVRYLQDLDMSWIDRTKNYCCVVEYENCDSFSVASYSSTIGERPLLRGLNGAATVLSGTGKVKLDLEFYETTSPSNLFRMGASIAVGTTASYKFRIAILQCTAAEVDLNTYKYDNINNLYTISLGNTYYGGSVDLSTGIMTVTWVGESINSADHTATSVIQANTIGASYLTQYRSYGVVATLTGLACNKFEPMNGDDDEEHIRLTGGANGSYTENIYINRSRLDLSGASDPNNPTLEEALVAVNAWLAVNPIFIAYKLFTPFTVSFTPLQIYSLSQPNPYSPNTVYSDQQSVLVKYPKSPIVSGSELDDAILSLGGD